MKKVLVFGTFDFLHPGHVHFLSSARKLGDHLTVVIARNSTVTKVKHHKPALDEAARMALVREMRCVDDVLLGDTADMYASLRHVRPDVIALGYDQHAFVDGLMERIRSLGLHTRVVRLDSFHEDQYKSTLIKKGEKTKKVSEDAKVFLVPLAIIIHNGKVFLQQRNDPGTVNHKKWEFPGGSVEWGETVEECLVREVKEETGYSVRPERLLSRIYTNYKVYDWGRVQVVLMPYLCTLLPSHLRISSREVLATGWYTFPLALRKDLLPKNREMLRLAQKYAFYD